jgi:hypothetical protein
MVGRLVDCSFWALSSAIDARRCPGMYEVAENARGAFSTVNRSAIHPTFALVAERHGEMTFHSSIRISLGSRSIWPLALANLNSPTSRDQWSHRVNGQAMKLSYVLCMSGNLFGSGVNTKHGKDDRQGFYDRTSIGHIKPDKLRKKDDSHSREHHVD